MAENSERQGQQLTAIDLMVLTILDQSLTKADLIRIVEKTDDQTLHYLAQQRTESHFLDATNQDIGVARSVVFLIIRCEMTKRGGRRFVASQPKGKPDEDGT